MLIPSVKLHHYAFPNLIRMSCGMSDSISTLSRKQRTVMCMVSSVEPVQQNTLREMPEEIRYLANVSSHSAPNKMHKYRK